MDRQVIEADPRETGVAVYAPEASKEASRVLDRIRAVTQREPDGWWIDDSNPKIERTGSLVIDPLHKNAAAKVEIQMIGGNTGILNVPLMDLDDWNKDLIKGQHVVCQINIQPSSFGEISIHPQKTTAQLLSNGQWMETRPSNQDGEQAKALPPTNQIPTLIDHFLEISHSPKVLEARQFFPTGQALAIAAKDALSRYSSSLTGQEQMANASAYHPDDDKLYEDSILATIIDKANDDKTINKEDRLVLSLAAHVQRGNSKK